MEKEFIKIEGNIEDPKIQKGLLANLFEQILKDLSWEYMRKLQFNRVLNIHDELKDYIMNLYDEVCPESQAPFSKKFYETTFDIWWEDGIEKALATDY